MCTHTCTHAQKHKHTRQCARGPQQNELTNIHTNCRDGPLFIVAADGIGGHEQEEQEEEDSPQLLRTRSDASFMHIQRRSKTHSAHDLQRLRTHRFSINGHFYNHKVPRTERTVMRSTVDASSGTVRHAFLLDMCPMMTFAGARCEMNEPCAFGLQ